MSTRGMIARQNGEGFEGVYHHFDSYPDGLGKTLWEQIQWRLQDESIEGVEKFVKILLDEHRAGWSSINEVDWSLAPGYGSKGPQCYCHGERSEPANELITESTANWLFIEWAYVIDIEKQTFTIVEGCQRNGIGNNKSSDGYGYKIINTFPFSGEEPNWSKLTEEE